jgi:hypothetical protein
MKKLVKYIKIIKIFIITLIIVLLVNAVFDSVVKTKEGEFYVQHDIILKAIHDYIASYGKVPNGLEDLNLVQLPDSINYYPVAWSKAGEILLQSKFLDFYFVTFGDEKAAVLRSYQIRERDSSGDITVIKNALNPDHSVERTNLFFSLFKFWNFLFWVSVLCFILIIEHCITKKQNIQ